MADNVTASSTDGLGAVFATDDDGVAHWPYAKIAWGANNTQTPVASGASAVPIQDGGNTITVDGTVTANLGATDNAVLDTIEVNTSDAAALLATIDTDTSNLAGAVSGTTIKVTVENTTTVSGTVTANLSATDNAVLDNIDTNTTGLAGTVSGSSLSVIIDTDNVGLSITQYAEGSSGATLTGTLALMEVASDVVSPIQGTVADGLLVNLGSNNDVTVTGTVTANLGATDNAVLDAIEAATSSGTVLLGTIDSDTSSLAGTVSGSSISVIIDTDNVGIGGGTQYTEDTVDTTITGTVMMMEVAADAVFPVQGTSAGGIIVDLGSNNDVTVTGTVDLGATDNAVLDAIEVATSSGTVLLGTIDADTSSLAGCVGGTEIQVDVVASLPAGTNVIGDVGISGARTSGGTTLYRNVDVDETEDAIKASAGQLYWIHAMNLTASVLYLQLYNATVASVTVGSTTPDLTFPVPTQGDTNGAGFVLAIPNGIVFDTAMTIACTTTIGGSSGPAANGMVVNAGYA